MAGPLAVALEFLRAAIVDWRERRDARQLARRARAKIARERKALKAAREEYARAMASKRAKELADAQEASRKRDVAWRKIADEHYRDLDDNPYD